jgi:integrase
VRYADAEYFNNSKKAARAAHTQRPVRYPSLDQCLHAFKAMPEDDKFQKRDKALFAFFILTGARVGAAVTLTRSTSTTLRRRHEPPTLSGRSHIRPWISACTPSRQCRKMTSSRSGIRLSLPSSC